MADTSGWQLPSSRRTIVIRAALGSLLASGLAAVIAIVLNQGFGSSDVLPFMLWSLPFAGGLTAASLFLIRLYCRLSRLIRYIVAVLLGGISGAMWTYFVALLFGPWMGAFSFPVFACWVAGGASGMIAVAGGCSDMKKGVVVVELALVVLIILSATIGMGPFFTKLSGDQNLEVVFVQWRPGPEPLSVKEIPPMAEFPATKLTGKEVAQLEAMGLSGTLNIVGSSEHGNGKRSRAVIVMEHQITNAVELLQPDRAEVIYLQNGNEWKMYPPDAPTLKRVIRLEVLPISPRNTQCMVELSYGAMQGGLAFSW